MLVIQEVFKEVLLVLGKTQLPTPAVRLVPDIFADLSFMQDLLGVWVKETTCVTTVWYKVDALLIIYLEMKAYLSLHIYAAKVSIPCCALHKNEGCP